MLTRSVALGFLLVAFTATPAFADDVTLTDEGFEPERLTVEEGTTVVWHNATGRVQVVVADDNSWDSGPVEAGASFSVRMREQGEVGYATADGAAAGRIIVIAVQEPDGDEAHEDEGQDGGEEGPEEYTTLPVTGADPLVLLGVGLLLVGTGGLLLRVRG